MKTVKYPIIVASTFIWIGFVCAISFMEAWLKFQAPGVTIPLGLGIGRIVFNALNNVEWFCAIVIVITFLYHKNQVVSRDNLMYLIPMLVLVVQTFWLLPVLDERAEATIAGKALTPSNLHVYYVGMEIMKVACLAVFGIKQFKTT